MKSTFHCRLCRKELFHQDHVITHVPDRKKTKNEPLNSCNINESCKHQIFLQDKLEWMSNDDLSKVEGKLFCPNDKCQCRLGSFNWSGSPCSCGTWIVPSIKFISCKIDEKKVICLE